MKNLLRVMLEGAFTNFKRIFFASDRVTDMDIRNSILEGRVKATDKVAKVSCIGCGGCANVCPTNAIDMKALDKPILITDEWVKKELPVLNSEKCVFCYHCHDFCPTYALFGEKGTIHPTDVGEVNLNMEKLIETPIKISDDKLAIISQFLADKTILKNEDVDKLNKISEVKNSDEIVSSTTKNNNENKNKNDSRKSINIDTSNINEFGKYNNISDKNELNVSDNYDNNDDAIYADVIEIRDNLIAKIREEAESDSEEYYNSNKKENKDNEDNNKN